MEQNESNLGAESAPPERPYEDDFYVSRPTQRTLFFRTFLPWQLIRFLWINFKMLVMIRKSHQG